MINFISLHIVVAPENSSPRAVAKIDRKKHNTYFYK
jgi:hypothetical protein